MTRSLERRARIGSVALVAFLGAILAAHGCAPRGFTEVVLTIDAQPRVRAAATQLRVRVFDSDRTEVVLEETLESPELPLTLPLYPRGGDAQRTFLVEVVAMDASGAVIATGLVEGGYLEDQRVGAVLCLEDACFEVDCGGAPCAAGDCQTCRGPSAVCSSAAVSLVPLDAALGCPAADCVPTAANEIRCADGVDDDCNGQMDCQDEACAGLPCMRPGFACEGGICRCRQSEICDNGINDDCDDAVDCEDDECWGEVCDAGTGLRCNRDSESCSTCPGTGENCGDGMDNDCDSLVDCADPDCCAADDRCEGQRLGTGDNRMCCGGNSVRIDEPERCGACDVRCPERPDGLLRACFALTIDPEVTEPTWLCACRLGGGCRGGMTCERAFDRLRCNCQQDSHCGEGLECVQTGPGRDNYCRPKPL